jgi:hypothetical protein
MSAHRLTCWSLVCRSLTIVCALWPVSLQVSTLLAQTLPYGPEGPTYHQWFDSYVYPNSYHSIHDVDFKSLTVTFANNKNGRLILVQLRDGKWEVRSRLGQNSVRLSAVHFLSSADPGREYALGVYREDDVGIAQVLELADERLRVADQINWDLHYGGPYGPLDGFDEKTNTLTIDSAHYQPGDGRCCVSAFDVVTYRWDGWGFTQTAIHTALSNYGRLKHKVPQPKSIPVHMP